MNQNNNPEKEIAVTENKTVNTATNQAEMYQKFIKPYKYAVCIIFGVFAITILIGVVFYLTKPSPDNKGFDTAINAYLSQIDNVISYRPSTYGYDIIYITVDESSWRGSDIDKVKYCDAIRQTLTAYGWKYNIISNKEAVSVIFETESGVRLAEPDGMQFGKYKIFY